jgi:PAS domain S-box-containing protein
MSKASILIVEDSFIVAFHLQKTLEREGYVVVGTEASGEGALNLLEKHRPDIVLMDIMLNGKLDGIETARTVRLKHNLPVIYITALTDKETIERAKITEPYGYLTKPFEDREIFTVIEMALYKHNIEMRLRQSEEKYLSTIKSITDGVLVIDDQFKITYMNPSAEKICGLKHVDIQYKTVFQVVQIFDSSTRDTVNPFQCNLAFAPVSTLPDQLVLVDPDNVEKPIEGNLSPLIDTKGRMIGLVMILKDISEKIAHEKLLKEIEKTHLAALMEGQEKERTRIAKDLHDGLGQMLNAIKMNVKLLGKENQQATFLYRLIDEAIQESVRISENLVPAKLKDFDLATCLRSLCNGIKDASGSSISFDSFGGSVEIDQTKKVNLYRITQEAISNAIKHAEASSIMVQLNEDVDVIRLTIEDDGKGFSNGAIYDQSLHHGLVNMRERAEILGGTFTIESDPSRGTLIIVETPLKSK